MSSMGKPSCFQQCLEGMLLTGSKELLLSYQVERPPRSIVLQWQVDRQLEQQREDPNHKQEGHDIDRQLDHARDEQHGVNDRDPDQEKANRPDDSPQAAEKDV